MQKKQKDIQLDDDKSQILLIQRAFRAMIAREKVNRLREEELEFLGMKFNKEEEMVDI